MKIKRFVLGEFEVNNYLLVNNKEGVLIDVGFEPEPIEQYIKEHNIELKAILLTHAHLDHIGGVEHIRARINAPVYVHEKEKDWLKHPVLNGSEAYPHFGQVICKPADFLIKDEQILTIGSFSFKIISTPGHTPGGLCYYINSSLFSGDTLFQRSIGRTDLYGGDMWALEKSIKEKLYILPDETIVYPGHGPKTTIDKEKKTNPYIR